ncbi:MAG: sulfatase [Holophagales bacterium]|nr:sulfatase [Holophagales bacterium]
MKTPRLLALLVVVLTLPACPGRRPEGPRTFPGAPVVLVCVDTLRSDRLPFYGYAGVETPALTALRNDAVLFERAYSHVPLTLPAHASIFTGTLPGAHGLLDNAGYRLAEGLPTLAEILKKEGYATGAAVSSVVLQGTSGISRGFDLWDDAIEPEKAGLPMNRVQRSGLRSAAILNTWIDTQKASPFLAFLHVYEPHSPYEPPEPFRSRYAQPYDGEVAASDAVVGALIDRLKALGLYDKSLVIFLSDHGEGLGEHGENEHGVFLYRESLQVPLLVKLPGNALAGTTVSAPVQISDVFATVVEAVGRRALPRARSSRTSWPSRTVRRRPNGGSTPRPSTLGSASAGASSLRSSTGSGTTSTPRSRSSSTSRRTRAERRTWPRRNPARSAPSSSRRRNAARRSRRRPPSTRSTRRSSPRSAT